MRLCWQCGEEFEPTNRGGSPRRYCSAPCGRRARWLRRPQADREAYRREVGLRQYGLTPGGYQEMLDAQGRKCAICGSTEPGGRGSHFHVDHCHGSGKVRGLLCHSCNVGLGALKDDPSILRLAIGYLEASLAPSHK